MRIVSLSSGSKGNSTFIEYAGTRLLIDAGISEKKLRERLAEIGERLDDITAVLVTHEHIDHIRAVKMLSKKYDMDFYVEEELVSHENFGFEFKEGKLKGIGFDKFSIGDIEILPFQTSHDAICPVGYVLNAKNSHSRFAIVTDTGEITEKIRQTLAGVKMVFIESNYDEKMLLTGGYPERLKMRIFGNKGHLSNIESLEFAKFLYKNGTKCFVLSHISENNNTYEKAYCNFADYFESQDLSLDKDVFIRLSYQDRRGNSFLLKEEFD